jgi:hypothetical protein
VKYARPGQGLTEAVLAHVSIAEEQGVCAKETVVMQGLNYWHTLGSGRVVSRRRDERESVVEVDYSRSFRPKKLAQLAVCSLVPDRGAGQGQGFHVLYPVVVVGVAYYPMATSL